MENTTQINNDIADKLRKDIVTMRIKKGLTQEEMGKLVYGDDCIYPKQYVNRVENSTGDIGIRTAQKYLQVFGLDIKFKTVK